MQKECEIWDDIKLTRKISAPGGRVGAYGRITIHNAKEVVFGYVSSKTDFKLKNGYMRTDEGIIPLCYTHKLNARNCVTAIGRKKRGEEFKPLMREVAIYPKPKYNYFDIVRISKKGYFKESEKTVREFLAEDKDLDELEGKIYRTIEINTT